MVRKEREGFGQPGGGSSAFSTRLLLSRGRRGVGLVSWGEGDWDAARQGFVPQRPAACPSPTLSRASARIQKETPAPRRSLAIRLDPQGGLRGGGARRRLLPRRRRRPACSAAGRRVAARGGPLLASATVAAGAQEPPRAFRRAGRAPGAACRRGEAARRETAARCPARAAMLSAPARGGQGPGHPAGGSFPLRRELSPRGARARLASGLALAEAPCLAAAGALPRPRHRPPQGSFLGSSTPRQPSSFLLPSLVCDAVPRAIPDTGRRRRRLPPGRLSSPPPPPRSARGKPPRRSPGGAALDGSDGRPGRHGPQA